MENVIEIRDLSHTYTRGDGVPVQALDDINLTIPRGEFIALVGPSGCGKSTLLNLLAGLLVPSTGSILIENSSVTEAVRNKRIGFVFQDPVLLPWRDTKSNIQLPLELSGSSKDDQNQIQALINLVMLKGFEHSYPRELSGGMRSRVAIARALILSPSILLMDEPFGSLDEITAHNLNTEVLRIWQERKPTIIFVTHSISQAVFMANQVIVLSQRPGHIVKEIAIDLPRPRTSETLSLQRFVEVNTLVRQELIENFNA